ncbi:MAG: cupin domain-containing protein [Planctomycetaceae bacterium]|nr:MAG: cupin domain-containing protein [Planctomycetaceae bacterium]
MSIPHASPGELIDVRPFGANWGDHRTTTLFKSEQLEVLRLVLPAGKVIAEHQAPGEITVQCLEGRIAFSVAGERREMVAGQLLYLTAGQPHALEGLEDGSVLVTLAIPGKR